MPATSPHPNNCSSVVEESVCRQNSAWPGIRDLGIGQFGRQLPTRCDKPLRYAAFILKVAAVVRVFVVFRTNLALEILARRNLFPLILLKPWIRLFLGRKPNRIR